MKDRPLEQKQLVDALDTIRTSLSKRHVLIPLGRQAFLPGTLCPDSVDGTGGEQVALRLGGLREDCSREDAKNKIQELIGTKKVKTEEVKSGEPEIKGSSFPYYEIREEYDGSEQVNGEAINITKQLDYLENKYAPEQQLAEEAEELIPDTSPQQKVLSDEAFTALSSRLDELARLEERAEKIASENQNSSRRVQGSGWGRGFLNAKPKKKKSTQTRTVTKDDVKQPSARKVGFQETSQVQEIPRIGQRSVKELRPPSNSSTAHLRESVLSNTVLERRKDEVPAPPQALTPSSSLLRTQPLVEREGGRQDKEPAAAPKRQSRFARQRQGLQ